FEGLSRGLSDGIDDKLFYAWDDVMNLQDGIGRMFGVGYCMMKKRFPVGLCALLLGVSLNGMAVARDAPLVLQRNGRTISLEPYAPNILRVTLSVDRAAVTSPPGYGFQARPSAKGWTHTRDAAGGDVFRSAKMIVRVAPGDLAPDQLPQRMPLDALNQQLRKVLRGVA